MVWILINSPESLSPSDALTPLTAPAPHPSLIHCSSLTECLRSVWQYSAMLEWIFSLFWLDFGLPGSLSPLWKLLPENLQVLLPPLSRSKAIRKEAAWACGPRFLNTTGRSTQNIPSNINFLFEYRSYPNDFGPRKRVLRVLPAYGTALLLVALAVNHSKDAPPALRRNHDTVMEYCPGSLPLNFVLMNNLVGFGGCGVVRIH